MNFSWYTVDVIKTTPPWWHSSIIYQIYPRSYKDSTGDGVGDLKGIISKLDYLLELRVDAIWLNPFFSSPMKDFGYDISDYTQVDHIFGSNKDMFELIETCHGKGIKVIFDLVLNHTSADHPWFIESSSSLANPKRDWYVWQKQVPNNWESIFGGSAWEKSETTGEYFYHTFLPSQPDLNLYNPEVKAEIFKVVNYFLELGVDGFRLDAINTFFEDPLLQDNLPLEIGNHHKLTRFKSNINTFDHDCNFDFIYDLKDLINQYGDKLLIGETNKMGPISGKWTKYLQHKDRSGIDIVFNFDLLYDIIDKDLVTKSIQAWQDNQDHGYPTYALSSHDQLRFVSRLSIEKLSVDETANKTKMLAVFLLTIKGLPFIYYGDELGLPEYTDFTTDQIRDTWAIQNDYSVPTRDGCRTPMLWDNSLSAGFSDSNKTWLPIHENFQDLSVETQKQDPNSILNHYKKIIDLRSNSSVLQTGELELIETSDGSIKYKRFEDGSEIFVILNFEKELVPVDLNTANILDSNNFDLNTKNLHRFGYVIYTG